MNRTLLIIVSLFFVLGTACAQEKKERKSPLKEATASMAGADIKVVYSSPSVKGRTIWGELVPYNKVWRTGANEATTFETSADIKVQGKSLPAGKYALFTIPSEKGWTIIFNEVWEQWGAYKYDESKDKLRISVNPKKAEHEEMMVISLQDAKMIIAWEKLMLQLTITE
jgi:hypothetical protein